MDATVAHGWQVTERANTATTVIRERWRTFLVINEKLKKDKYLHHCRNAGWAFLPMAFGTWGGGDRPGCLQATLAHSCKISRVARWESAVPETRGATPEARSQELRHNLGLSLTKHIWEVLDAKNLLQ